MNLSLAIRSLLTFQPPTARIREERRESAKLAEEVALLAAEMAIRQLGQEQAARAETDGDARQQ